MTHQEHMDAAAASLGPVVIDASDLFAGWRAKLILNANGSPKACLANILIAVRYTPDLKCSVRYNEYAHRIEVALPLPWDKDLQSEWTSRTWSDDDDVRLAEWLQRQGIMAKLGEVGPAVASVARQHSYHPLREYLDGLHWDCVERIESQLPILFGVVVTRYSAAVFHCMMLSAVARVMQPGCKVDTVLTLEGAQGKRKSSAIERLFGKEYFTDDLAELGSKDAAMQMAGVWVVEIAEFAATKRADMDKAKAFITRKIDRFRPPYGKNVIEAPRSSIMVATTNLDDWNKDETGGRRYCPVQCLGTIDLDGITEVRDQLWAEAVARYHAGEQWWLTDELAELAREEMASRFVGDPWEPPIQEAIRDCLEVTCEHLLTNVLNVERARQRQGDLLRVGRILKRLGWVKQRVRREGDRVIVYTRPVNLATPGQGLATVGGG